MKKYFHVVNIGIQNLLVYRVNFFFRAAFGLIPLTATLMLWRAIYEGKASGEAIAGYPLAQMVSYYLILTVVDALTAVNEDDWQIAADIKDGNISQFLLKPIDYLTYRFFLFLTGRAIYTVVAICRGTGQHRGAAGVRGLHRVDGAVAVFHLLHDGVAGVLGAGGGDLHLCAVRL
jgi:ABC-type uncharacterized transport system permease subunit